MGEQERLQQLRPALEIRGRVFHAVREFFASAGYLEIDSPVRIPIPALESHIDAEPSGNQFLRTSPELHMKRLLAAGFERIYQMGPCFRSGECGALHQPEFTMLEWYRAHTDYRGILDETIALLRHIAQALNQNARWIDDLEILTVDEAFQTFAGWSPLSDFDADRFDLDLVDRVEPQLSRDHPVILIDYPAPLGALARVRGPVAERWELYLHGVEIANAYSELTDPVEQRARFETCAEERAARGQAVYAIDEAFMQALPLLPPTGGIAVGMDRLAMIFAGKTRLDEITAFPTPHE